MCHMSSCFSNALPVLPCSPLIDSELESAEYEPHHEPVLEVLQALQTHHRQLAEHRQHEVLQERVAEDADRNRRLTELKGATTMSAQT